MVNDDEGFLASVFTLQHDLLKQKKNRRIVEVNCKITKQEKSGFECKNATDWRTEPYHIVSGPRFGDLLGPYTVV